ncbi:MAG TPA: phenylalanine--tRNA ligase subunit alpha [Bdellovibrionota bacterium]|jgi:phenylalanyl-tRNA synthetase alpha chain|nr:phenylalanine--tRNA ligase subunit alpha [Bdellovibrionota bacterium]
MSDPLSTFQDEAAALESKLLSQLEELKTSSELEQFRVEALGKKGVLTGLMRHLATMTAEQKPKAGQAVNGVRAKVEAKLESILQGVVASEQGERIKAERIDVTLPARSVSTSRPHPVMVVQDELVRILARAGFSVEIGPELENEFYNFDALNFPPSHPARTMQDTFFVSREKNWLLRTHTSPVQVRTMMGRKPPIRIASPGRVYRSDYDATHSPMFHQIEGLWIDTEVSMSDLKGTLELLVAEFFGSGLAIRLRPSFFPFTEPSAELDMACCFCKGKGCRTCKGTGWIEIGGCGMVDPEVIKASGLDPKIYRGFAFGMGLERMAMLKFGVDDLRSFYESPSSYLSRFAKYGAE